MIEFRPPRNEKEWENYYDLRYRILREPLGKERGSEKNESDELENTFAFMTMGF